jgi:hypothetical protein
MQFFTIKNWSELQHYTDRTPPWIKLYNHLLDDYEFACLQDASKLHLVLIWLLASRNNNRLPFNPKWIKQRIGVESDVDLKELLDAGFITLEPSNDGVLQSPEQDASRVLADCKQDACLEERERRERGEQSREEKRDKNSVDYSPLNLAQSHIDEIIRIRKKNSKSAKAAVISQRIVNTMVKEFDLAYEAGYSIDNILDCWDNTTWQSFRFEWMVNRIGKSPVLQASENREQELQEWFNSSNQSGRKNTIDNDSGELL